MCPESDSDPRDDPQTATPSERSGDLESDPCDQDFEIDASVTRIGRYEIIRRLGKGGFGHVYLAADPELRRQVAIKIPRWDRPLSDRAVEQFLREGRMLAQANHPSIVGVYDVATTEDGIPFVVMEFVEGRNLSTIIRNDTLTQREILAILLKVAGALQQAHRKGLVHRDFKPANVIVDDEGQIHLVDFGLALHDELSADDLAADQVAGTPGYMAPEQVRGENHLIDGQTDIWAFGVTMYRMLVGAMPFRNKGQRELMRAICYKNPKPLRQLKPNVSRQLERICLRCLQKLMEDRYQSMADVIEELEAFVAESEQETEKVTDVSESPSVQKLAKLDSRTDGVIDPQSRDSNVPTSGESGSATGPTHPTASGRSHSQSQSGRAPLPIVPKGLRAFDKNDKDFFLRLLPGPTDRLGIPESIRFWVGRLDVLDQVDDVPIGIIYGPSGSGKSSFVRAGLVPCLSENVIDVYVDCNTDNLESHIADRLSRECHSIPPGESLSRILRMVRQGHYVRSGDKVLIILDQFEQWLSATSDLEQQELTEALRQCDADRVQALILVRDEFWLTASQYLRLLGSRLEEHRNAMPLPLFDKRHARNVLEGIGRALDNLPPEGQPLSRSQKSFLKEAIDALAERDRVICVHLTVFAETMKNAPWDIGQLRAMGGWSGIGREYIAGIFTNPETPGFIQRHSQEAWAILKQLLPVRATELKGATVSREGLFAGCDLKMSRACFDELVRFMERDCNLISRAEHADEEDPDAPGMDNGGSGDVQSEGPRYSLTHDFLVKPIREWGDAKQNETLGGRATSDLINLANQWELTQDRRFLPSLWDYGRFALFADANAKSEKREFWRQATRREFVVGGIAGALLAGGTLGLSEVLRTRNQARELDAEKRRRALSEKLEFYLRCYPEELESAFDDIADHLDELELELTRAVDRREPVKRHRARSALLVKDPTGENLVANIADQLDQLPDDEHRSFRLAMEHSSLDLWRKQFAVTYAAFQDVQDYNEAKERGTEKHRRAEALSVQSARMAIVLAELGDREPLRQMVTAKANPWDRSVAILQIARWFSDASTLFETMAQVDLTLENGDLLSGYLSGLGLRSADGFSSQQIESMRDWLQTVYQTMDHGGAHYASWYALSQLDLEIPDARSTGNPDCQWQVINYESRSGKQFDLHMVKIPGGELEIGAGLDSFEQTQDWREENEDDPYLKGKGTLVSIDSFWLAVFEMGLTPFDDFLLHNPRHSEYLENQRNKSGYQGQLVLSKGSPRYPVTHASWIAAAEFANELTESVFETEGYYRNLGEKPMQVQRPASDGCFRLPTEVEFEWAWRGLSKTRYAQGPTTDLLDSLCGIGTKKITDSGEYPPNPFGCFDLTSNQSEWSGVLSSRNEYLTFAAVKGGSRDYDTVAAVPANATPFPINSQLAFRVVVDSP